MASAFQAEPNDPRRAPWVGVVRNVASESVPLNGWLTAHNIVFRNGAAVKVDGWSAHAASVTGSINLIKPVRYKSDATATVVGTNQYLYRLSGTTATALNTLPFSSAPGDRWDADYLYKKWYFTNRTDGLISWNGVGALEVVATGGLRGRVLVQFENHLLLANLASVDTNGAYTLVGSSLISDGAVAWNVEDVNSDALLMEIPDNGDAIVRLLRGTGALEIYKQNSVHLLGYVGGDAVYNLNRRVPHMGISAPWSLVDLGDKRVWIGQDNVYIFNSSSIADIGSRIWKWWVDQVADGAVGRVWAFHDARFNEVVFGFETSTTGRGLVWNYEYNAFSTRDWPFTAAGVVESRDTITTITEENPTFDDLNVPMDELVLGNSSEDVETIDQRGLLAGDADGALWNLLADVKTANGENLTATLESGDTDYGNSARLKLCGGMYVDAVDVTGAAPLQVYVMPRDSLAAAETWKGPYTVNSRGRCDFQCTGRFFRFKFEKTDGGFTLRGYQPLFQLRGER